MKQAQDLKNFSISVDNETGMQRFARLWADCLQPPMVIYLVGDLGVGKTTLVRGIVQGMGYTGRVKSPTYGLLEKYTLTNAQDQSLEVMHLDLYRLTDPEELEFIGLRDLLGQNSVLLVEWPDQGKGYLPAADLIVNIQQPDAASDARLLTCFASSDCGEELLSALQGRF